MGDIIEELRKAIDNYENDKCETEIVNFSLDPGAGSVLNVNETFTFKIRVRNQSHLDMKNVTVRSYGSNYAQVAYGTSRFGSRADSPVFNLDAHQTYTTGIFRGKAIRVTEKERDIVTARINTYDVSLDHIFKDHTGAGNLEGILKADIRAD